MRIVAGRHRARRLEAPPGIGTRPTAARAREAVFNRLVHGSFGDGSGEGGASLLIGAKVLDAFAGSGANGLEALSRGAAHASFMEADGGASAAIAANIAQLGETDRSLLLAADATRPPPAAAPCGLVFLDPPYASGLAPAALAALLHAGWIDDKAILVVEVAADEAFEPPPGFTHLDTRTYGAAKIVFLRRQARAGAAV
jgi:16S rRNA (guanine966-N2)-methyltransferase